VFIKELEPQSTPMTSLHRESTTGGMLTGMGDTRPPGDEEEDMSMSTGAGSNDSGSGADTSRWTPGGGGGGLSSWFDSNTDIQSAVSSVGRQHRSNASSQQDCFQTHSRLLLNINE